MWYDSKKDDAELEFCVLDETIPPCPECEKHFFHQQQTFNLLEAGVVVVSILTLLTDIVTDTLVTCQYFASGEYSWGLLTLGFMLLPSICVQFFSLRWYQVDEDLSAGKWIIHVLQLGPLYRYFVVLQTGMAAKRSQDPHDFDLLYHQQSDACMLRLFESFMESAPQVVLQLYIMVATNEENFFTGISAMVSIVSLCWAIAVYSRIHRRVREDKTVVSWPGVILQAVWRIGMISSRIIALVLFATVFKAYVFLVIVLHWLAMMLWVVLQNTDFCLTWLEERLFNAVIAVVYVFCFFNLKEGTSRYRVLVFYSVMFVENVLFLVLWNSAALEREFYTEVGFSIVFGGFFIGVTSMILYYRYLHPHSSEGGCSVGGSTPKHQPCLRHEDALINYRHPKGLEAEISPRSQSPSPHSLFHRVHQYSPLALPISVFTTPGSHATTPGLQRPASSASHGEPGGIGREFKVHQRARSESCLLLQDRSVPVHLREGPFMAKSLCGLAAAADGGHLSEWVGHFVDERKGFTEEFFDRLTPDILGQPPTDDHPADRCKSETDGDLAKSQDRRPQSVSRVDSVSKKLFKGSADRRMHRSFRRQLQYEGADKEPGTPAGPNEKLHRPPRRMVMDSEKSQGTLMTPHGRFLERPKTRTPNGGLCGLPRGVQECHGIPTGIQVMQMSTTPDRPMKGSPWAQHTPAGNPNKEQRVPKELLKLPENNVRSKLKVFEALGMANTSLTDSVSKKGTAGSSPMTDKTTCASAGPKQQLRAAVTEDPSIATGKIQLDSRPPTTGSRALVAGKAQPKTSSQPPSNGNGSPITTTAIRSTPERRGDGAELQQHDDRDKEHYEDTPAMTENVKGDVAMEASCDLLDQDQKCDEPKMGLSQDSHQTDELCLCIPPAALCLPAHPGGVASTGVRINLDVNMPSSRDLVGKVASSPRRMDGRDIGQKSPLLEIQPTSSSTPRAISSVSGKENQASGKARKSFGNVKINDIKESIANSPRKKDPKKSRMSFSRIPTDIVAKRVSSLVSTPEQ